MYCHNCNYHLYGTESYCPNCGTATNKEDSTKNVVIDDIDRTTENNRTVSIVLGSISLGGVFLCIFSPISLILSIIGLVLALKANKKVKNTVGIVLNSISLFLSAILTFIIVAIAFFIVHYGSEFIDDNPILDSYGEPIITNNYGEDF